MPCHASLSAITQALIIIIIMRYEYMYEYVYELDLVTSN